MSRRPDLGASLALTVMALSGCQTGGAARPAPSPALAERVVEVGPSASALVSDALSARTSVGLPEVAVETVDPILYSLVAVDPVLVEAAGVWTTAWTTRRAETFQRYLERMQQYDQVVEDEIRARGLPESLRYLPLVESGYSPVAVSRVGATGLWQLMGPTARELGLTVNSIVDDRRDPVASTVAALDYLEGLHAEFGSWLLALAAYNGGPGRIRRALTRSGRSAAETEVGSFLEIRGYLPRETRDFIPRFLAAATLAADPTAHGFGAVASEPMAYDEVTVPDATSLDVVATAAQVPEERIRRLNPHYVRGYTPYGESRTVRVPSGLADRFEVNFAAIPPNQRLSFLEHVVAAGDTFGHIAMRYGVSVSELVDTNRRVDPRRLQIGMNVVVPLTGAALREGAIADD